MGRPRGRTAAVARSAMPLLLALLLALPAILPLAAPGYFFKAHDAHHSVFWLVEYDSAVRDGAFWPVWAPDHALGFGYPLWLVYAPLAYAVAEVFHLFGLGFAAAVKATWALGFLLGALGTYRLARRWWGPAAALLASLAYTYAPYHLVQIYVRADLAEFMAWAWFPWAWLALVELWDDPRPRRAAWTATAVAVLLLIHTVSLLIFPFVLAGFILLKVVQDRRRDRRLPWRPLAWSAGAAALGGVIAAGFLLPAFLSLRYVVQSQWTPANYLYSRQFVYLNQWWSPLWGFGHGLAGPDDGMSFQLGLLPFLGGVLGLVALLAPARGGTRGVHFPYRAEGVYLAFVTVAGLFLMTEASLPVWGVLPFGNMIQFPWRLLALTMVTLALLAGLAARWLEGERPVPSAYVYVAALAIVLAGFPYTQPELQPVRPEDESPVAVMEFETAYKDMRGSTVWAQRAPLDGDSPLVAQYYAGEPLQRAGIASGQGVILSQQARSLSTEALVRADGAVGLRFYIYYFPGWQATVDGRPVPIRPEGPNGLIGLTLPPGEHQVRVHFGSTPDRTAGSVLSLAGVAIAAWLWLRDRRPGHLRAGTADAIIPGREPG